MRPPGGPLPDAPVRAIAAAALAAAFLMLAGCGDSGATESAASSAPSPSPTVNDFGCLSPEQAKTGSVTFKSADDQDVEAFESGSGRTALILAHQADGDVCQWVPHAMELAGDGYRVLAVNSAGSDVAELTAAARYVRARGAVKVLLIGASKGGTAVLSAAGVVTPRVDAVVSLSAPASFTGMDAANVVPDLTMPVFYMAAASDSGFADSTRDLSRATTKGRQNELHIVGGAEHGVGLLDDDENYARVKAFLAKYGS